MLCSCLLTRGEDYAFQRLSLVRRKLRTLELKTGAPRARIGPQPHPVWNRGADAGERHLAEQDEEAYRRLIANWQASRPRASAGATAGRAS